MPEHDFDTVTQYASPDLIGAMAYREHPVIDDPNWRLSGADTRAEYARWAGNICGMACLSMALLHRHGASPTLFQLLKGARRHGAYVEREDGTIKGLIYDPFVRYVRTELDLGAETQAQLPMRDLLMLLSQGFTVIASVHKEIRRPERPAPGKGGHLIYATGTSDGRIHFRNPSGHTEGARTAILPAEVFARFYAERGVSLA
ncbi:peptidase [Streptomyces goshikiensis]|uniref:peptidase n=1 Tax=Streptomyces goshikiensis TaxID=1942 RepID=UPI0033EF0DE2